MSFHGCGFAVLGAFAGLYGTVWIICYLTGHPL